MAYKRKGPMSAVHMIRSFLRYCAGGVLPGAETPSPGHCSRKEKTAVMMAFRGPGCTALNQAQVPRGKIGTDTRRALQLSGA